MHDRRTWRYKRREFVLDALADVNALDGGTGFILVKQADGTFAFADPGVGPEGTSFPGIVGDGSPIGVVAQEVGRPLYVDETNGDVYVSTGATEDDWALAFDAEGSASAIGADLATHAADATAVHGIADTAQLAKLDGDVAFVGNLGLDGNIAFQFPVIEDVDGAPLVLLADVIAVLGDMRAKFNTLLADLRTRGDLAE